MRILVVSDIHYASPAERLRPDYEAAAVRSGWQRVLVRAYRHTIWLRDPFAHNGLLDRFLDESGEADLVVANGDYCCDTAFVGVADDAAAESARLCLGRLRERYGRGFRAVPGDHELGKRSLCGGQGGLRLASWRRATGELGLAPWWRVDLGEVVVLGLTSTLLALPIYAVEMLGEEAAEWWLMREAYCREVSAVLEGVGADRRLLLFLHDPTALPYLAALPAMRARMHQVEATIIGHLHTPLILAASRLLAGIPPIRFLGNAVRRMSEALHRAGTWRSFRLHLCPSLAGLELLKDGGYLELSWSGGGMGRDWRITRHGLARMG